MQTRSSDENSVCPSVLCQTGAMWQNGIKICPESSRSLSHLLMSFLYEYVEAGGAIAPQTWVLLPFLQKNLWLQQQYAAVKPANSYTEGIFGCFCSF